MRNTKTLLGVAAAVLLVGGAARGWAQDLKLAPRSPKGTNLFTILAPTLGAEAKGWARIEAKALGDVYYFTAQLSVRPKDFKAFGIDPNDGFDDEEMVIMTRDATRKMQFAYMELTGPVFTLQESDSGPMPAQRGDAVRVVVNGNEAAAGKF